MNKKRLFVTTNYSKIETMYSQTGYEAEKEYAAANFKSLPRDFKDANGYKIICLEDNFIDWAIYTLNKQYDFILYHTSSPENVKSALNNLKNNGIKIIDGSHELGEPHDKVFQFLLSGDDDFNKIIDKLFPSVVITNHDGSQSPIYKQTTCEAYRTLYKSMTLACIKEKIGSDNSAEVSDIESQLDVIAKYFKDNSDVQLPTNGAPIEIYEFLINNHSKIEDQLFD